MKATADQVCVGAGRLKPILDNIEKSAGELRGLRVHGDPAQLTRLEPTILEALREIEEGNDRLGGLLSRLVTEGAEFLPEVARSLDGAGAAGLTVALAATDEATLDGLFARYTMERERDVHREFLRGFDVAPKEPAKAAAPADADDGLELF